MAELILIITVLIILTQGIELLFAFFTGIRSKGELLLIFYANIAVNTPSILISRLCYYFGGVSLYKYAFLLEILVVTVEGIIFSKYSKSIKHPFIFAFAINALSFTAGLIVGG